jgi:serine/threonine protein kinase
VVGGLDKQAPLSKMCLACNREFQADIAKCPHDGTALISLKQEDEWIGATIGDRYEVVELLGKGGMGVVYLARQKMMDRYVAIKMLQAQLTQDEISVKRFQQEAKAASCLNHPHLVMLHDYGITETGQPYLVMEYLQGRSLLQVIKREGILTPQKAAKIFSEVADGLAHAHHQGIVHRDMKPSNILLVEQEGDPDFVKVVDFGLAKMMPWSGKESQHLTKTGEVFGSPIYMSPEQCMGKELRPTSDIYSLGIALYESLTGRPPFRGANSIATASKHLSDPPPAFSETRPDLQLPESLEKIIFKALAKDPAARFQDMAEFKDALEASVKSPGLSSSSSSSSVRLQRLNAPQNSTIAIPSMKLQQELALSHSALKAATAPDPEPPRSRKGLMIALAAAVVLIFGGGVFVWWLLNGLQSKPVQLEILSIRANPPEVQAIDLSNQARKTIKLSPQAIKQLTALGARNNQGDAAGSLVGSVVGATMDRGQQVAQAIELRDTDQAVHDAYAVVHDCLETICALDTAQATNSFVNMSVGELKKDFPDDAIIRLGNGIQGGAASKESATSNNFVDSRMDDCIRVQGLPEAGKVNVLVKKEAFVSGPKTTLLFVVDNGKIENYKEVQSYK